MRYAYHGDRRREGEERRLTPIIVCRACTKSTELEANRSGFVTSVISKRTLSGGYRVAMGAT